MRFVRALSQETRFNNNRRRVFTVPFPPALMALTSFSNFRPLNYILGIKRYSQRMFNDAAELVMDSPLRSWAMQVNCPESLSLSTLVMCRLEPFWCLLVVLAIFEPKKFLFRKGRTLRKAATYRSTPSSR